MKRRIKNKQSTQIRKTKDHNAFSEVCHTVKDTSIKYGIILSLCFYFYKLIPFVSLVSRLMVTVMIFYHGFNRYNTNIYSNFCLTLGILHTFFIIIDTTTTVITYVRKMRNDFVCNKKAPCAVSTSKIQSNLKCVVSYYYAMQDLLFIGLIFIENRKLVLDRALFFYFSIFSLSLSFVFYHRHDSNKHVQLDKQSFEVEVVTNSNQVLDSLPEVICTLIDSTTIDELKNSESRPAFLPTIITPFSNDGISDHSSNEMKIFDNVDTKANIEIEEKMKTSDHSTNKEFVISSTNSKLDDSVGKQNLSNKIAKSSQPTNKTHSNAMKNQAMITINTIKHDKVFKPIKINIQQSSKPVLKSKSKSSLTQAQTQPQVQAQNPSTPTSNLNISIYTNRTLDLPNKKDYKLDMSQSNSNQSSNKGSRKHNDARTSTKTSAKSQKVGRKIIPGHMDTTIVISSCSIPRSGAASMDSEKEENTSVTSTSICAYTNGGTNAIQAYGLDYVDPDIGINGNIDMSLELDDLVDFDDLNQYGQDNVKCIGAAATYGY